MKRCKICIMPDTFPGITYDSEGVCSMCSNFKDQKQYIPSIESLRSRLDIIMKESEAKGLKYDALVAYSGGKDSTYLIYVLTQIYRLKVLALTFDNGFMSEYSFVNMRNVMNKLNADHMIICPDASIMKKIFIESTCENIYPQHLIKFGSGICISCIRMVNNMSLRVAIEKKIPMVMLGNSPGQLIQSESEIIFQDNKIPYELRKRLFKPLADRIGDEVYYYLMLSKEEYKTNPFPYTINAFPLIGYDEGKIYSTIKDFGWKKPEDVDPNSTNCRLNSLGIIKHKEQYNFHPYDYEMSMLVRLGIINREEALKRVEDPEGKAFALAEEVAKKLMP